MYDSDCNCVMRGGDGTIPLVFSDIGKCNWRCPKKLNCEHFKDMRDTHNADKRRKQTVRNIINQALDQ